MKCEQRRWTSPSGWQGDRPNLPDAGLVLYFGARAALADGARHRELRAAYPHAHVLGCSTGGQIQGDEIDDDGVAAVAVQFDSTRLRLACEEAIVADGAHASGAALGQALAAPDLAAIFVLSDGLHINGSSLVAGITGVVGTAIPVTGGLAGDGAQFLATLVGAGDHAPSERLVAALGFYGSEIRIGHGSAGGWDAFGPHRRVTGSAGNVLMTLDGEPALDLYERYLGDEAEGLPGTALLFPLRIWDPAKPSHDVVRTVLAVDRVRRTMTFAGDVPEGWVAQLMRGGFDRLTAGAAEAAAQAAVGQEPGEQLAILVSCIGRRLLMGQSIHDELEATAAQFSPETTRIGFYSYGEISPHAVSGLCELHNQTMTVTALTELRAA